MKIWMHKGSALSLKDFFLHYQKTVEKWKGENHSLALTIFT